MRKEAVYAVMLNVTLFHGMQCVIAQDPRYLRLSVLESGSTTHYNLRVRFALSAVAVVAHYPGAQVGSAKGAQDLLNEITANLPPA